MVKPAAGLPLQCSTYWCARGFPLPRLPCVDNLRHAAGTRVYGFKSNFSVGLRFAYFLSGPAALRV